MFNYDSQTKASRICMMFRNEIVCLSINEGGEGDFVRFNPRNSYKNEFWYIEKVNKGFYTNDQSVFSLRT